MDEVEAFCETVVPRVAGEPARLMALGAVDRGIAASLPADRGATITAALGGTSPGRTTRCAPRNCSPGLPPTTRPRSSFVVCAAP